MIGSPNSLVYMIEAENGMIKIGVSNSPEKRARAILSASPVKTRLIAVFPGAFREELRMHKRFENCRAWGEWFYPYGDFLAFVEQHRWNSVPVIEWESIRHLPTILETRAKRSASMKAAWNVPGARENWFSNRRSKTSPETREDAA